MIPSADIDAALRVLHWYSTCTKQEYMQALEPVLSMSPADVAERAGLSIHTIYQTRRSWWKASDKKLSFEDTVLLLAL